MKKLKRSIAFLLALCVILTLLPPAQFADAAEVIQRYELDTDGIDAGATYLIVNAGTAGDGNALRFYYNNAWNCDLRNQSLTIKSEDGVTFIETGFTNEENCRFQFTGANAGRVTHGDYSLDLDNSRYESGNSGATLSFTNLENGQYRIHYTTSGWWNTTTYYLRYSNSDWSGSETTASVYLFKLIFSRRYSNGNAFYSPVKPCEQSLCIFGRNAPVAFFKKHNKACKIGGEGVYIFYVG